MLTRTVTFQLNPESYSVSIRASLLFKGWLLLSQPPADIHYITTRVRGLSMLQVTKKHDRPGGRGPCQEEEFHLPVPHSEGVEDEGSKEEEEA